MKILFALLLAFTDVGWASDWRVAVPGWTYEFPRDHGVHPDFKTEWWYFTGNLRDDRGRRFGYQLTFFRQGIRPPAKRGAETSRLIVDELKFAHFALTDVTGEDFVFHQKMSRGSFGEAGFAAAGRIAWIDDWTLTLGDDGAIHVTARHGENVIDLTLRPAKSWAVHGRDGISQKTAGAGHASHYYSGTRLTTSGQLRTGGSAFAVSGESWFDHEWASNQLTPEQAGWDWFSLQLDDGSELMLYQMRLRDGRLDAASSGTFIASDGRTQHLNREDYALKPVKFWKSAKSGARYPIAWELRAVSLDLVLRITSPVAAQELALEPVTYWEGAIDFAGSRGELKIGGHGYMELTGYAGEIVGLSAP